MHAYTFLAAIKLILICQQVSLSLCFSAAYLRSLRKPKTKKKGCKMLYSSAELRQFTMSDSFPITHSIKKGNDQEIMKK